MAACRRANARILEGGIPTVPVLTYIQSMARSLVSRIAALVIATLVASSGSSLGVAHGYAHHEAGEHAGQDRAYDAGAAAEDTGELHDGLLQSVDEAKRDHAHPQVGRALSVRVAPPLFALSTRGGSVPESIVRVVGTASLPLNAAPAPARHPDASPQQPRAPPLG